MENNKFKTRQEIADKYGISVKTLLSRLLKNGYALNSGRIPPKEAKEIDDIFLPPDPTS